MASRTRGILTTMRTALQGIDGTGTYTHDLSATGRVRIGRPGPRDGRTPPCAWLAIGSLKSEHGPELGRYTRTLVVDVEMRVPATSAETDERALIAADALNDVCIALEADRWLLSGGTRQVNDLIIEGATFDGDELGIPGCAIARAQVSVYWFADSAAGV